MFSPKSMSNLGRLTVCCYDAKYINVFCNTHNDKNARSISVTLFLLIHHINVHVL
jgi:hypothetical protein